METSTWKKDPVHDSSGMHHVPGNSLNKKCQTRSRAGQALLKTSKGARIGKAVDIPDGRPQPLCKERHQSFPNTFMAFTQFVKIPTGIFFVGGRQGRIHKIMFIPTNSPPPLTVPDML